MKRKGLYEPFPKAGPVKITHPDGTTETRRQYNVAERARVIGGGTPDHRASRSHHQDVRAEASSLRKTDLLDNLAYVRYLADQKTRRLQHKARH